MTQLSRRHNDAKTYPDLADTQNENAAETRGRACNESKALHRYGQQPQDWRPAHVDVQAPEKYDIAIVQVLLLMLSQETHSD